MIKKKKNSQPFAVPTKDSLTADLLTAFEVKRYDVCLELLERGARVNDRVKVDGRTLLHNAVVLQELAFSEALLDYGAEVDAADLDGKTPFMLACQMGNLAFAELLLSRGAKVDARDSNEGTALHESCGVPTLRNVVNEESASDRAVSFLLEHGANPNARNSSDYTPLMLASRVNAERRCSFLIDHGADVNFVDCLGDSVVERAVMGNAVGVIELLHRHQADFSVRTQDGWTLLQLAAQRGSNKVCRLLVDYGLDIHACGPEAAPNRTALVIAALAGHHATMIKLMTLGADPTADIARLSADEISLMKEANLRILRAPLHAAIESEDTQAFLELLERGHDSHAKNGRRQGALVFAESSGFDGAARVIRSFLARREADAAMREALSTGP